MRWMIPFLVVGCGTEQGTLLTIQAPEGPDDVARLEIVLANPSPEAITTFDQRVAPRDATTEEGVRYYRQRATAGSIANVDETDGFTVRIEPNVAMTQETTFIPFLVAYDAQDNVIGVGAVLDAAGEPTSVIIEDKITRQYFVTMTALRAMDPAGGMAAGESLHLACRTDARTWSSGVAWRPVATQLRLLFPDRSQDEDAFDATERAADLDCDGHEAPDRDCDDLRPAFHVGRQDVCDGVDSNCDGAQQMVRDCTTSACTTSGVQLCDDRTGEPIGACLANAQCACSNGPCAQCSLSFRLGSAPDRRQPCAPGVGKMRFANCSAQSPCTIEVLHGNLWYGFIGPTANGPFSTKITINAGEAYLEAKLAGTEVMGFGGDSVGTLNLVITQAGQSRLLPVDIRLLESQPVQQCMPMAGSNLYAMTCFP